MKIKTLVRLFRNGQFPVFINLFSMFKPYYKLCYIASAKDNGLFDKLSGKPVPFEHLADIYCADRNSYDALEAWLQLGKRLKLLKSDKQGYSLRGLSKKLVSRENDALVANVQEATGLHYNLILNTPKKLREGSLWGLEDQDGEIIARSSRALEPFQIEAIDRNFPPSGAVRLLEVGCGTAVYIRYAATKNPSLSAVGIELQPNVADMAKRNIQEWELRDRVKIEACDIRDRKPDEHFDIVTLYNNIYYFPVEDRISFLGHIREFLRPGGFLLLTTACQGGGAICDILNLWGASTTGCGRLASVDELVLQLQKAGYNDVQTMKLMPGEEFYGFKAQYSVEH